MKWLNFPNSKFSPLPPLSVLDLTRFCCQKHKTLQTTLMGIFFWLKNRKYILGYWYFFKVTHQMDEWYSSACWYVLCFKPNNFQVIKEISGIYNSFINILIEFSNSIFIKLCFTTLKKRLVSNLYSKQFSLLGFSLTSPFALQTQKGQKLSGPSHHLGPDEGSTKNLLQNVHHIQIPICILQ